MTIIQAIVLGIIQGLTEFLPISSSGHLVIFQHLFGLKEPELIFDISVHVGTLVAVVLFFKKDIYEILKSIQQSLLLLIKDRKINFQTNPHLKFVWLIIVGSIPTGIIGLALKKKAEILFSSVAIVGLMLLITGLLLWITRWFNTKETKPLSMVHAIIIGVVQGIAIMPGISRSGSTISVGLYMGLSRETAAKFSFLLSIPAIVGAELLSIKDMLENPTSFDMTIIIGTIIAGLSGYAALKLLMYVVNKGHLYVFTPYCFLAGVIALWIGR